MDARARQITRAGRRLFRPTERGGDAPETAFAAHRRLVAIHPFNDGNGRTPRLLMNLVLIRGGYPAVAVRPEDRPAYIAALQRAEAGGGTDAFDRLLYQRQDATLGEYVAAARMAVPRSGGALVEGRQTREALASLCMFVKRHVARKSDASVG